MIERPNRIQIRPDFQSLDPEGRIHGQGSREGGACQIQDHFSQVLKQRFCKCTSLLTWKSVVGTVDEDYLGIIKASAV